LRENKLFTVEGTMKLPNELKLNHTNHRHGGKITRVTGINHETARPQYGRSQDFWFFIGDVEWDDGTKSADTEIAPWALAQYDGTEDGRQEIENLLRVMNAYLDANGEWHHQGKHQGWYATKRK
jgi:hypothetical protein